MLRCEACGARVANLRRGRCAICYLRWAEVRPVGLGAVCVICGERRRDYLRSVEFQCSWLPMCHCCAARSLKLSPVPRTIDGLRRALDRDRRGRERRTGGPASDAVEHERRRSDRRAASASLQIDDVESEAFDSSIEWIDAEDLIIEILDDTTIGEATQIREAPRQEAGSPADNA